MADEESENVSGTCVHCQRSTTLVCSGCYEAPLYDESFIEPAFCCCNTECMDSLWAEHGSKCSKLQARKLLNRAAMLLQAIIYRIRLHASPLRFKSLRLEGSTIFLDGFQSTTEFHSRESEPALKPFPIPLDGDGSSAKAVVVYMASLEAMRYLHGFTKELLAKISSKIQETTIRVIDPKLRICPVAPNGQMIDLPYPFVHYLYKVTLKNGEVWAVDPTGSQYGYPDPLCPWHSLEQRRSYKVGGIEMYGALKQQAYQAGRTIPMRHFVAEMTEKRALTEKIENKIPALAEACENNILGGTDANSEKAKHRFLDQLDGHLRVSMSELSAPGQIAGRNKMIDAQMAENMKTSVEGRKAWDEAVEFMASEFLKSTLQEAVPPREMSKPQKEGNPFFED